MQVAGGTRAVLELRRFWWSCRSTDTGDPRWLLWGNSTSDAKNGTHFERGPTIHAAARFSGGAPFVPMVEPADLRDRDHRPEFRRLDGS